MTGNKKLIAPGLAFDPNFRKKDGMRDGLRTSTIMSRIKLVEKLANRKPTVSSRRLTQLMGQAQSPGKVYIERTYEEIAATEPNLDFDAIANHSHLVIGSPNPLRQFSTPEKGALMSKLYSPQGTEYHNQGAITIKYNGEKINCALFFFSR